MFDHKRQFGALAIASMIFISCGGAPETEVTGEDNIISDAAHGGAVAGFYFLPPMVPNPGYRGTPVAALSPVVEINELGGRQIARFDASANGEHYQVDWHTDRFNLSTS